MVVADIPRGIPGWVACCEDRCCLEPDEVLLLCLCALVLDFWICIDFCSERSECYRLVVVTVPVGPWRVLADFLESKVFGVVCVAVCVAVCVSRVVALVSLFCRNPLAVLLKGVLV